MSTNEITYEQPLNEHIRVCLRLENYFQQLKHHLDNPSPLGSQMALSTLLDCLNVIDRPDLRSKLTNALRHHTTMLAHLEGSPGVDRKKLRSVLDQLDRMIDSLHTAQGKIGQTLRENDFLNAIRQRMTHIGGACGFSTPAYHLWLQQDDKLRTRDLRAWSRSFDLLQKIVSLLLELTRGTPQVENTVAHNGFYQAALDATTRHQLIQVTLDKKFKIYPEISVGRHRLSIHFYTFNTTGRPDKSMKDIPFLLRCCS